MVNQARSRGTGRRMSTLQAARLRLEAALEQANGGVTPTSRLTSVEAAYWTNVGTKEHLRWVMPHPEDELLDAVVQRRGRRTAQFAGARRARHRLLS